MRLVDRFLFVCCCVFLVWCFVINVCRLLVVGCWLLLLFAGCSLFLSVWIFDGLKLRCVDAVLMCWLSLCSLWFVVCSACLRLVVCCLMLCVNCSLFCDSFLVMYSL